MLKKADLLFLSFLRENSRATLTMISRKTMIPITTLYDKLRQHEQGLIMKHTTLLDFTKLGFYCRANIMLRASRECRDKLASYLKVHPAINNLYKINNGYDLLAEGVFENVKDLEEFIEELDQNFLIEDKKTHYIIEDIKREEFLSKSSALQTPLIKE